MKSPSDILSPSITDTIRSHGAGAELLRDLHYGQLELIYRQGWLNMFVPKDLGGLGMSLPEVLATEECLAWADGSTAWVVTLCSGAGWFAGFLDPALAKEVFAEKNACVAGSGAVSGSANRVGDLYEISGRWKYASGSLHATVLTANCLLLKDGKTVRRSDGAPEVRSVLMKAGEVNIVKTWNAMGMVATGSHSFEVTRMKLPANRLFVIDAANATHPDASYQYPFHQLAEATLAVNLSGMAFRFMELCDEFFDRKKGLRPIGTADLGPLLRASKKQLNIRRRDMYEAVEQSWKSCQKARKVPAAQRNAVSRTSLALARSSWELTNQLFPYCALTAADMGFEINRVWRNIHTASQHTVFNFRI